MSPETWSLTELVTVLENPTLRDSELAALLDGRSAKAVTIIRLGMCAMHRDMAIAGRAFSVAELQGHLAEDGRPGYTCAKCGSPV